MDVKFIKANYKLKASFSIEASVIIPFICLFLFTSMSITFYLHDIIATEARVALSTEQLRMAVIYSKIPGESKIFEGGFELESAKKILENKTDVTEEEANSFLFLAKAQRYQLSNDSDYVKAQTRLSTSKNWYMLLPEGFADREIISLRDNASPTKHLRGTRLVYKLWKAVSGG